MKQFLFVACCGVALVVPVAVLAGGASSGFDGVVDAIESRYHVQAMRIPFLGVISLIARKSTHEDVRNLHVAEIEHFSAEVDGNELDQIVREKLGLGWERFVRETSRHGQEQTLVFTRPEGQRMGLFVVDVEGHEMEVVQVSVEPDRLGASIGKYRHHQQIGDHDDSD